MKTKVWVDGSTTRAAYILRDERVIHPFGKKVTNNEGEYYAIILALWECFGRGFWDVEIFSDSQLCVNQLNGKYKVREARLLTLWNAANIAAQRFHSVKYLWIPREENPAGKLLEKETKIRKGVK